MTTERSGPELVRDDELTRELRALYAPPQNAAYWTDLEARIMARVESGEWVEALWSVPDRWLRAGLVAAGIAVIVAASLLLRAQTEEARMAYETVVEPASVEILELAERQKLGQQQATLRILLGY